MPHVNDDNGCNNECLGPRNSYLRLRSFFHLANERSLAPIEIREAPILEWMHAELQRSDKRRLILSQFLPRFLPSISRFGDIRSRTRKKERSVYTIPLEASSIIHRIRPSFADIHRPFPFRSFRSFNIRFNDGARLCENSA